MAAEAERMGQALADKEKIAKASDSRDLRLSGRDEALAELAAAERHLMAMRQEILDSHGQEKGTDYELASTRQAALIKEELAFEAEGVLNDKASNYREAYGLELLEEIRQIAVTTKQNGYHPAALLPDEIDPNHPVGIFQLSPEALKENGIDPAAPPAEQLRQGRKAFKRLLVGYKGAYEKALTAFHAGTTTGDEIARGRAEPSPELAAKVGGAVNQALRTEMAGIGLDHGPRSREKTASISEFR